jgi:hypothetical protein
MKMTIYVFHTTRVAKPQGWEEDWPQAAYLLETVTGFTGTVSVQIPTDSCGIKPSRKSGKQWASAFKIQWKYQQYKNVPDDKLEEQLANSTEQNHYCKTCISKFLAFY